MKIKILKFKEFKKFKNNLNEMAFKNPKTGKPYQEGDVVREWTTKDIKQQSGVDPNDAIFYMKIIDNSREYIYGEILFINCGTSWLPNLRIHSNKADLPGKEWDYIQPKFNEIKELEGKKWFIYGDEEVFMDIKGNKINLKEGIYTYNGYSLNFKLTREFKEPVIGINLQNKSELFYIKLSDVKDLSEELTAMEYEAIADWFNENTGMEVISKGNKFKIKQLWIFAGSNPDFLYRSKKDKMFRKIIAGPFINMKQAKQMLEYLKKMNSITFYDKNKLIIDEKISFKNNHIITTLDELIEFVKKNGIKVDIKDILAKKL